MCIAGDQGQVALVPKLCLGTPVLEATLPDMFPMSGKQSLLDCVPKRSLGTSFVVS
jgi:hypothetical protein